MNTPTWTTVFGALCVGWAMGWGSGSIFGMMSERGRYEMERRLENMIQGREDEEEQPPGIVQEEIDKEKTP